MSVARAQKRIMLWTVPRCLSTAFCRAMVSRKSCKVSLLERKPCDQGCDCVCICVCVGDKDRIR